MVSSRSFTMIELLISLAVVLIVTTLAVPRFLSQQDYVVHELALLRATIVSLQQRAVVSGMPMVLSCDPEQHQYGCQQIPGMVYHMRYKVQFGCIPNAKGPPSKPYHAIKQPITFESGRIICYPDGTTNAGAVYLVNAEKTQMYALVCGITPIGYIRTYRYDRGSWKLT